MRVLITCPYLDSTPGGVTSYFNSVKKYLPPDVDFLEIGALKEKENIIEKLRHLYSDRNRLNKLLSEDPAKYDLVHINPSFLYASLIRDGLLLRVAKRLGRKTVIFFRGWDGKYVNLVDRYFLRLFLSTYGKADAFIVLSSDFKYQLRKWGLNQPIFLETTLVDDGLLNGFSVRKKAGEIKYEREIRLLFLARIEKEKGICEAIEVVKKLSQRHPNVCLVVAGDGPFIDKARQFSKKLELTDRVTFLGYVRGEAKKEILSNSDICIFPTYYGEGMPNSVLEAMAFGLPIVTRPVGGLKDLFVDGQHGFMSESKDPAIFAALVEKIILDEKLWRKISITVHEFAAEKLLGSKVARRLGNIYMHVLRSGEK